MPYDPNRLHKSLVTERKALDKQWDIWMKNALNGLIDRETVVVLMDRYNKIDMQIIRENMKGIFNAC